MNENGILTIAFGKDRYINMAMDLGRSIKLNSPGIETAIVTDSENSDIASLYDYLIPLNKDYGKNVEQKLHIDKYSPFENTLFIDSDCLTFRSLEFAFDLFLDSKSIALGTEFFYPGDNCEFADINEITQKLNIKKIPRFNGGVYYVSKTSTQPDILEYARSLLENYKEIGFWSFRNQGPNDELLIGAAIEKMGFQNISDDSKLMRTPIGILGPLFVDVFKNKSEFNKYGHKVNPAIVHFAGGIVECKEYKREAGKLKVYYKSNFLKKANVQLYHIFFNLKIWFKVLRNKLWAITPRLLRLIYHGLRKRL